MIFKPGALDPRKLGDALTKERIVVTVRGANGSNPGLRASPHFYNTMDDIDRFVGTIGKYMRTAVRFGITHGRVTEDLLLAGSGPAPGRRPRARPPDIPVS